MSRTITPERFGEFFQALHRGPGRGPIRPFLWQQRLAERVCLEGWPKTLALPTASGKTACIDIAIFALACQADRKPAERTAPRRIFFVVDRRVIVDQAYERARRIAKALHTREEGDGESPAILKEVARALRQIGGLEEAEPPLLCGQLRGGIYRDQTWARTPTQPTVLASTVDQIGSRLLFRGYGVSDSLRPIHAGLAGNDALILLDEAHCAEPFRQTAEAVRDYRELTTGAAFTLPFQFGVLSATPTDEGSSEDGTFRLLPAEREDEHLAPRLRAAKPTRLRSIPVSGKEEKRRATFAAHLAEEAEAMVERHGLKTVAVFVNRVATARFVEEILRVKRPNEEIVLMTGRMRPIDRDSLLATYEKRLQAGREGSPDRPIIVVATQCLEVGADFDFDAVVTECASLDALRQRFGRLNRLGGRQGSRGSILIRADHIVPDDGIATLDDKKKDPIYGGALAATWNWLHSQAAASADGEGSEIDFGINAFEALLSGEQADRDLPKRLQAPTDDAPVMLPSHVDCLAQTSPVPEPDPDISLFLHGPKEANPAVQVCWRSDLDPERPDDWVEILSLCPPSSSECLPVPITALRRWLFEEQGDDDASDLEQTAAPLPEEGEQSNPALAALIWRGLKEGKSKPIRLPSDLRPGDTVVIVADRDEARNTLTQLGQVREHDASLDQGEQAYIRARRRAILRLHPSRIALWGTTPGLETLKSTIREVGQSLDEPLEGWKGVCGALHRQLASEKHAEDANPDLMWLRRVAEELSQDDDIEALPYPSTSLDPMEAKGAAGAFGVVLLGSRRAFDLAPREDAFESEDTQTSDEDEGSVGKCVPLVDHTRGVVRRVANFADTLGLPVGLRTALLLAAEWHDLGKLDRRFQGWLQGGRDTSKDPLAKGLKLSRSARDKARARSGYPRGGRHEHPSVRLAEHFAMDVDRDLVLHLIGSHHGQVRPFATIVQDDSALTVSTRRIGFDAETSADTGLHRIGSGAAERFWGLTRRHGWWGLAWLESILRLADHRQSEAEQLPGNGESRGEDRATWAPPAMVKPPATPEREFPLAGPDGGNPLGFLAALGTLRTLANAWPERRVRMSWRVAGTWRPVLHMRGDTDEAEIIGTLHARLKLMLGEEELWGIGADLSLEPGDFRAAVRGAQALARKTGDRTRADFLAAFGCEATVTRPPSGPPLIQDTALRTMSGAGHQHFLDSMKAIVGRTEPVHLDKALFHPWRYDDAVEKQTMRWDPADDVRRAYRWRKPSGDPERERRGGMLGANRLAIEALPLIPTIPVGRVLRTVGFSQGRGGTNWTWPLWSEPIGPDIVRSLLAHPALAEDPDEEAMRELAGIGTVEVYRSRRLTIDKFRCFTLAQSLGSE